MARARLFLLFSGRAEPADFARSVCDRLGLGPGPGPWWVYCGLEPGRLLLSELPFPGATTQLPLQRPPFCPFAALEQQPPGTSGLKLPRDREVDVGVSVVLQSSDQSVLLTRRASSLHTSPNLWVPPGGHVELDEELFDGGLRELREETGLQLPQGQHSRFFLGLWESAYPSRLSQGLPRYHHIVLYVLVASQETEQQLQDEVSAYAWLKPDLVAAVAASEEAPETGDPVSESLPPFIQAVELQGDTARTVDLPTSILLQKTLATEQNEERVSTGTKFALSLWLQHLKRASEHPTHTAPKPESE
ncbi:nucleoside diphosphate-linked moiety X motif 17 isoform X3 [Gracilinanus agilis]|uniref:nucleoside diphosphate-linked moiety X motif 17 isoform X3 n=1 Tax=Gracilinanus agilis TaxID=191870 RepID=UPI001CFC5C30|nr:nucleoside diphosphate-linked moiety X motif 17 isoform X3 [Gracilinanus agilis]